MASFNSSEPPPEPTPPSQDTTDEAPLPPPDHPTSEELELLSGRTWDGVRYSHDELKAALADAGVALDSLHQQGGMWVAAARRDG